MTKKSVFGDLGVFAPVKVAKTPKPVLEPMVEPIKTKKDKSSGILASKVPKKDESVTSFIKRRNKKMGL